MNTRRRPAGSIISHASLPSILGRVAAASMLTAAVLVVSSREVHASGRDLSGQSPTPHHAEYPAPAAHVPDHPDRLARADQTRSVTHALARATLLGAVGGRRTPVAPVPALVPAPQPIATGGGGVGGETLVTVTLRPVIPPSIPAPRAATGQPESAVSPAHASAAVRPSPAPRRPSIGSSSSGAPLPPPPPPLVAVAPVAPGAPLVVPGVGRAAAGYVLGSSLATVLLCMFAGLLGAALLPRRR